MMTTERPDVVATRRYTARETRELLGIHRNTLLNHTRRGDIRCVRHMYGRNIYYTGLEILKFWNRTV